MNITSVLKVLANDKRLLILHWLKEPEKYFSSIHSNVAQDGVCVGSIAEKIGLSQSTVSQYLHLMQQAGLVLTERRGQWTYCKRNETSLKGLFKELEKL